MIPLVLKDLRLSLDVMRPLAMVAGGLLAVVALLGLLPTSLLPTSFEGVTLAAILQLIAGSVLVFSSVIAAAITAVVLLGDRAHRAAALAASVPTGRWMRIGSKLFVTMILMSCMVLVSGSMLWPRTPGLPPSVSSGWWTNAMWSAAGASLVGMFFATSICAFVRRREVAIGLTVLAIALAALVAVLGAMAGLEWALLPLRDSAWSLNFPLDLEERDGARMVAMRMGVPIGIALASAFSLLVRWTPAMASNVRRAMTIGALIVATFVGSTIAATQAVRLDYFVARSLRYVTHRRDVAAWSDAALVPSIDRHMRSSAPGSGLDLEDRLRLLAEIDEARLRVGLMTDEQFDASPLAQAMVSAAGSDGPDARGLRVLLIDQTSPRSLRLALRFLNNARAVDVDVGYYAAFLVVCQELGPDAGARRSSELFDSKSRDERGPIIIEQLEQAAAKGHPLAAELRQAAARLRGIAPGGVQ